jgi:hypothetical protein
MAHRPSVRNDGAVDERALATVRVAAAALYASKVALASITGEVADEKR